MPPEPVGKTLRQRVEAKERELGLRCDDVVCGVGPGDDDYGDSNDNGDGGVASRSRSGRGGEDGRKVRMIKIHAAYDSLGRACEHMFHAGCLVTSARVAGEGEDGDGDGDLDEARERGLADAEVGTDAEEMIQVSCPVCRAEGSLTRGEWDEGVRMAMEVA